MAIKYCHIESVGQIPSTRALRLRLIEIYERWAYGGSAKAAEEAATLSLATNQQIPGAKDIASPGLAIPEETEVPYLTLLHHRP